MNGLQRGIKKAKKSLQALHGGEWQVQRHRGGARGASVAHLLHTRLCAGCSFAHLAHLLSTAPDTEQAFREFLVNECVCLHKAVRGPERLRKKVQREKMTLEKWVRALSARLRNSGSSCWELSAA